MPAASSSKHEKVMVIDDDIDIVFIIRRHLEKWGYSVDTFTDPLHALEVFKQSKGRYDLVLADVNMPEMNGIALAAMMQKIKPDTKIVIMTAFEVLPEELRASLPSISRKDILHKPFSMTEVCGAVKKRLAAA